MKDDRIESANKAHTKYQTILKDREVPLGCSHLLLEAKNVLDGSWFLLTQSNGTPDKDVRFFPISDLPKCIPEEQPMNVDTNKYIDNNWDKNSKKLLKKKKYKCLRDYIITHQATYDVKYFFLPVFNGLVNVIKHQACVVDQATGDLHTYYYNLAHQACVFMEDVVIELTKHWPGEAATTGNATNRANLEDMPGEAATTGSATNQPDLEAMPVEAATTGSATNQPDLEAMPVEAATTGSATNQPDLEAMPVEAATTGSATNQPDLEAMPVEAATTGSATNQPDLEAMPVEAATTGSETNQPDLEARTVEAATTGSATNQSDLEAMPGEATAKNQPVLEDSDTGRLSYSIYDEKEDEMASDHFRIAEVLLKPDKKLSEKLLFKSVGLGQMEAGEKLFEILENKWKETILLGKELLEKFVLVLICLDKKPKEDEKAGKIRDHLKKIMKQVSLCSWMLETDTDDKQFTKIREERVNLTKEMVRKIISHVTH